jgi:ABC-type Fe3+/spermidine/putrescine transport system ATPase subunit
MVPEPRLVMLDEPLGSLDRTIRERLVEELREILKNASQTALYVTHDQEEAFRIADRVVIIGSGKTAQIGTPQEIYQHPNSPYVARFLGMENFLEGEAKPEGAGSILNTVLGAWYVDKAYKGKGQILLRPDRVIWGEMSEADYVNLSGELLTKSFSGQISQIQVLINDIPLKFTLSNSEEDLTQPGDIVQLSFRADDAVHFFPDQP